MYPGHNPSMNCLRAWVSGQVQGVFFRDSTRRVARELGLSGYAVNLSDGRVEVLACGPPHRLQRLIDWLHQGPELARVDRVVVEETEATPVEGFRIG